MILLVEKDPKVKKKLCDMLNRERIIAVVTKQQILEALVHHRDRLRVLVANAVTLSDILSEDVILKLCIQLSIKVPPIVALYPPEQEAIMKNISNSKYRFEFVKFDKKDVDFPVSYTEAIKAVYPQVNIDIARAQEVWAQSEESDDLVDVRKWLNEFGFGETKQDSMVQPESKKSKSEKRGDAAPDYKKLYTDLKKKYDRLVADFEELKKILE
jgi:hypothetical protein